MMAVRECTADEVVRRGKEIYERDIRSTVEAGNRGKVLVLDICTGDYEIDDSHLEAGKRIRARHPEGEFYAMRIGFPAFAKIGGSWRNATR